MEAAAAAHVKFIVLDASIDRRRRVEGRCSTRGELHAWHSLPVRHGMTVGELARMFNETPSAPTSP